MANELTVTKEQTAKFVHDAMEMETAAFTLERAIEECREQKRQLLNKAHTNVNSAKTKLNKAQDNLNNIQSKLTQMRSNPPKLDFSESVLPPAIVIGGILDAIIVLILIMINFGNPDTITGFGFILAIIPAPLISGFIGYLFALSELNTATIKYKNEIQNEEVAYNKMNNKLTQATKNYNLALVYLSKTKAVAEPFDVQIAKLKDERDTIRNNLTNFYKLSVIPPDYRYSDCVFELNRIFRNDLADTMKEAILLYEDRVYKGTTLKLFGQIYEKLNEISNTMSDLTSYVSSINSNVKLMSQDLYTIAERMAQGQKDQQASTDELIRETQLSRYASERAADSAAYLEWHQRNQNY